MYFTVSSRCAIVSEKEWWLETQAGIVGRLLVGFAFGLSVLETGMWSEVVEMCVRGSHNVFV